MTTYLKDLIQSMVDMVNTDGTKQGLRVLDAQVVSLLSTKFCLAKDPKQAPHVRGSITI